jgi:hypothetical protein
VVLGGLGGLLPREGVGGDLGLGKRGGLEGTGFGLVRLLLGFCIKRRIIFILLFCKPVVFANPRQPEGGGERSIELISLEFKHMSV